MGADSSAVPWVSHQNGKFRILLVMLQDDAGGPQHFLRIP